MDEMPQDCALEIVDLAQAGMPHEVCGFVLMDWELMQVRNVSRNPERAFSLEHETLLDMLMYHRDTLRGIWHTHPSGRGHPSAEDKITMTLYPDLRHWIGTCANVYEWRLVDDDCRAVRRDGSAGIEGMAYPILAPPEALRRSG